MATGETGVVYLRHRFRQRLPRTPVRSTVAVLRRAAVLGLTVLGLTVLGPGSASAASNTTTTMAARFTGKSGAGLVAAAVTAGALPVATSLGVPLGKPSCPPIEKPKVGLTLQCLIAFDKHPIGWLVTLRADGTLATRPTFPVISKRTAEEFVGTGSVCALTSVAAQPIGSTVTCTIHKSTVELLVGPNGALSRR